MNVERDQDDQNNREPMSDLEARGVSRLLKTIAFMDEDPSEEILNDFIDNLK